jgi:small subunit ribosomal protein S11
MTKDIPTTDTKEEVVALKEQPVKSEAVVETAEKAPETTVATAKITKKKKVKKHVPVGQVHIQATFNNTIITVTDTTGNVIAAASAGNCGFRGSKKGTAYAAQIAVDKALTIAKQFGLAKADVYVKGIGLGRDSAIRSVSNNGVTVEAIKDVTGIPHGGCRPKKARRV